MKCKDCVYCWQAPGEKYPRCHFDGAFAAPCEYDDYDDEQ